MLNSSILWVNLFVERNYLKLIYSRKIDETNNLYNQKKIETGMMQHSRFIQIFNLELTYVIYKNHKDFNLQSKLFFE